MDSAAATPEEYLASLPDDRRDAVARVREVVNEHLPDGYVEQMDWGMISWVVPLERCPDTYNGKPLCYASLTSQKHHMALYLMGVYGDEGERAWLRAAVRRARPEARHGQVLRAVPDARRAAPRRRR